MKIFFLPILIIFFSCKKTDSNQSAPQPPPPKITVADSLFQIISTVKTKVNEFDIEYKVVPPPNEIFSDIYLQWSTAFNFTNNTDSALIPITNGQSNIFHISGLIRSFTYYGRIALTYKGKRFYSISQTWVNDTLQILTFGTFGIRRGLNRGDTTVIITNLEPLPPGLVTDSKIFLGPYECNLVSDQGLTISFSVPQTIPPGKYILKLQSRRMQAQSPDSTQVLRGNWSLINSPEIPINPNAQQSGLFFFGTCYSAQKGYMLGGAYWNGPQVSWPNSMYPEYIFEFDGAQKNWTKRTLSSPRYIEDPICYYYNNSIYVIGGKEWSFDQYGNQHGNNLKKMLRLDLGSLTWFELNDLPYGWIFNLTSFELNNEWYIGMGADSLNLSVCCGMPLPSKKFWKYNPAADQWTQLADFPGGHQNFPTSFSIGSKGYVFYGAIPIGDPINSIEFTKEFWEYNPATNSWTNIPLGADGPPAGEKYQIINYNGKAYFLTAQVRTLFGGGYGYLEKTSCVEWDPLTRIFKEVAFPKIPNIMKPIFKQGNTFFFQSDALGYFERFPNKTYSFSIDQ